VGTRLTGRFFLGIVHTVSYDGSSLAARFFLENVMFYGVEILKVLCPALPSKHKIASYMNSTLLYFIHNNLCLIFILYREFVVLQD